MSALTDFFTSLANKIRSKLGTSTAYTPVEAISAIDDVYIAGKTAGISAAKVGTAGAGDVLSGKTFTNSSTVGATGTMTNNGAVSPSGLNCGGSYTIPAGYHNGSGKVTANSLASQTRVDSGKTAVTAGTMVSGYQAWVNGSKISGTFAGQEKTVTAGTSAASVTPDSGKYLTKVTYNPTPSQTKSASPSTSAQTISPDSGKLLSSVSISAISPQRSAGTAATYSGVDSTGPYVYFPYGWWPQANTTYGNFTRMTAAQAVTACPKQEKTATPTTSSQSITPDSGKLLSKVTVNAVSLSGNAENANVLSGKTYYNTTLTKQTGTMANRSSTIQQATTSTSDQSKSCYRLNGTNIEVVPAIGYWGTWDWNTECIRVDRASCNYNTGTFTPTSNSSAHDMGDSNSYRYVNTNTVYNLGFANGWKEVFSYGTWHAYHGNKAVVYVSPNPYPYGRAKYYKIGGTSRNRNLNYSDDWVEALDSNWNVIDRTHFPNSSSTTTYTEISWNAGSNRINALAIYFGQFTGAYIEVDFNVIFTF